VLEVLRKLTAVRRFSIGRRVDIDPGYARSLGDKTYEYSAVLEFDSAADLKTYLTDPLHHELGRLFWANCDRAIVSETKSVDPDSPEAVDALVL
jgi:hypothetical protein